MASKQEQLDAILAETARQYEKLTDDLQTYAIKEVQRTISNLTDLLLQYSSDDVINKARITSLINDLQTIEQAIYTNGMQAMGEVVKQSAETSINGSVTALATAVGAGADITNDVFNRLSMETIRYVVNRFGNDGLVLSDRVWQLAKSQRAELEQVIRSGIIRGESVNKLVASVRKVYDNETWKIRRLVITEGNIAYRTGSAYVAQQSEFVKGLRIHHGEADRPEHRCTQLEGIDRYGLGKGVYKPDDPEVLNPHPNCTSYTTYELVEDVPETKKQVKAKAKKEKEKLDPFFATDALPMKFDKDEYNVLLDIAGYKQGINMVAKADVEAIMATKNSKEFRDLWYKWEDDEYLYRDLNILCRKIDELYKLKDNLYKVPNYKVGFGSDMAYNLGSDIFDLAELAEDELDGIYKYTGSYSSQVNTYWRKGAEKANVDKATALDVTDKVDRAIGKATLKENVMLYRGAGLDAVGGTIAQKAYGGNVQDIIGATVQDLGFMSTSIGANSAFGGDVTFQIKAPAGTQGIFVEDYTTHNGEYEVILARGTTLRIDDAKVTENGKLHLLMEVVGNG